MKKHLKRISLFLIVVLALGLFAGCGTPSNNSSSGNANNAAEPTVKFPEGSIEIIVPFAPGGGMDLLARATQPYLQAMGITTVVTNIEGGSSAIGSMEVFHSEPDGYRILCSGIETIMGYNMGGVLESKVEEYTQLGCLVYDAHIMCVPSDSPFQTVADLVAYAKDHPGELNWGGTGAKGNNQMASAEFWEAAGITVNFVPYDSGSKTRASIMGGVANSECDVIQVQLSEAKAIIDSGDCRPLAVFTKDRSSQYPDIPTLNEMGYNIDNGLHRGFFAPPGTPEEIQKIIADAFKKVYDNPEFQKACIENIAFDPFYISPADCTNVINTRYPIQTVLLEKMNATSK